MPSPAELISARLSATGITPKMADRIAHLIERDLRLGGCCIVPVMQLAFLTTELTALAANLRILADAAARLERRALTGKDKGNEKAF